MSIGTLTLESLGSWKRLSPRLRVWSIVGATVFLYLVLLAATGWSKGYIHQKAPLGVMLLGLVYGSVTALGAFGIILVYRANRFINFANGPLGAMVGVVAVGLVSAHGLNYWVALPGATIVGGAIGALTEKALFHREYQYLPSLRSAPRMLVTVVSIGLAGTFASLGFVGTHYEHFTALIGGFNPPFNVSFTIDHVTFTSAAVLVVIAIPVVIAFLAWFLLRTNAGIAVRAAAENEDRALTLGIPVRRLSTIVWVIAGALAALAYMLQAPFNGVQPTVTVINDPTVLLPILAAAVVARMESLPIAFGAAIALGMVFEIITWNQTPSGWLAPSSVYVVYLVVIVVALLAQSGKISRAQESGTSSWASVGLVKAVPTELRRLPEVRFVRWALLAVVAALFIWIPHGWSESSQLLTAFAVVWAMIAVSLVVLSGWSGQISLGQFGLAGVAGMIAGNMFAHWNSDFFLVTLCAGLAGAGVALIVGLPALRIKGQFLAVTTLAVAVALDQYFLNTNTFPHFIPGSGVPRALLLQRFNLNNFYELYIVCLVFLALAILITRGIRKSRAGRVLIGTQDNERAAQSAAVPTTSVKLGGFVIAGIIAGVAGMLQALLLGALNPQSYPAGDSITVFVYTVIGGLGSITGALSGVFFFKWLETQNWLGPYKLLVPNAVAVAMLNVFPRGFGQLIFSVRDAYLRRVADRRGILVPSLVADKRLSVPGATGGDLLAAMAASGNGIDDPTTELEVQH